MDRMAKARVRETDPVEGEYVRLSREEMETKTLGNLSSDQKIVVVRGRTTIHTTPRELMTFGRMPRFLTLAEVEFAFSTDDEPKERGAVVSLWSQRVPRGWG